MKNLIHVPVPDGIRALYSRHIARFWFSDTKSIQHFASGMVHPWLVEYWLLQGVRVE